MKQRQRDAELAFERICRKFIRCIRISVGRYGKPSVKKGRVSIRNNPYSEGISQEMNKSGTAKDIYLPSLRDWFP